MAELLNGVIVIPIERAVPVLVWHIGDVVRKLREAHDLAAKELAVKATIQPNTIGRIERYGTRFKVETLQDIARAFNTTVDGLFAQIPHAPEFCGRTASVTSAVSLPEDDHSRALVSWWPSLTLAQRQALVTIAEGMGRARANGATVDIDDSIGDRTPITPFK